MLTLTRPAAGDVPMVSAKSEHGFQATKRGINGEVITSYLPDFSLKSLVPR